MEGVTSTPLIRLASTPTTSAYAGCVVRTIAIPVRTNPHENPWVGQSRGIRQCYAVINHQATATGALS